MKVCSKCCRRKPDSFFGFRDKEHRVQRKVCKDCIREQRKGWWKTHYKKKAPYYRKKTAERNKRHQGDLKTKLYAYLLECACEECGEDDPIVLDFHHKTDDKEHTISAMIFNKMSWSSILEEIDKCKVLCANCHRKETARENGWYRYKFSEEVMRL